MPDHRGHYNTFLGAALTIVTLVILMLYGAFKAINLIEMQDYNLQEAVQEDYFTLPTAFTEADGFKVAASIIELESDD